jgi:hypothetical protein
MDPGQVGLYAILLTLVLLYEASYVPRQDQGLADMVYSCGWVFHHFMVGVHIDPPPLSSRERQQRTIFVPIWFARTGSIFSSTPCCDSITMT